MFHSSAQRSEDREGPRAKAVLPEGWRDSFGVGVEENEAAMNVDINEGFSQVDTISQENLPNEFTGKEAGE